MVSVGSRKRIKVIGPTRDDDNNNNPAEKSMQSPHSKALVLGDKRYCPHDGALLYLKPDTGNSICKLCGFIDGANPEGKHTSLLPTVSRNSRTNSYSDPTLIGLNIVPMDNKRRSTIKEEAHDMDTQILLDRGGITIIDEHTEVHEVGTYDYEEALTDKERMDRLTRNRYGS